MINGLRLFPLLLIVGLALALQASGMAGTQDAAARDGKVDFGINGHPFSPGSYHGISFERQISLLSDLRLRTYRVNLNPLHADKFDLLSQLVALAERSGIRILPVLTLPPKEYSNAREAYAAAKAGAYQVVKRFEGRISVWELGNEYDLYCVKTGTDGASPDDYDPGRFAIVEALIKGMLAGLREGSSSVRSIVQTSQHSPTSLDSGFLRRLIRDGVAFDITGYHYYSQDGRVPRLRDGTNALQVLHESFHKPIWITEFDQRSLSNDAGPNSDPKGQGKALTAGLTEITAEAAKYAVIGADIYELLDQPELFNVPGTKPNQAQFGILDSRGGSTDASRAVGDFLRAYR